MNTNLVKPRLFISKCIEIEYCRWNGGIISSDIVKKLKNHIDLITACPEKEIGLGVPRESLRLVNSENGVKLIQPATGKECTHSMTVYSKQFLSGIEPPDGFILKSKSPSCGFKDVKVYYHHQKAVQSAKEQGIFGKAVLSFYEGLPIEDEARLSNFRIREQFLSAVFTLARFRQAMVDPSIQALQDFHRRNKYLMMSFNQSRLKIMGAIAANLDHEELHSVIKSYRKELLLCLNTPRKTGSNVNILQHIMGYFKNDITASEKTHFLNLLDKYAKKQLPLSVPVEILRSWVFRFNQEYLMEQTYFQPYPEELVEISDSGKGRDL